MSALANPFQSFFDNPFQSFFGTQAFGGPDPFGHAFLGDLSGGDTIFHSTTSLAQQGPDGVQFTQSQSHSYGPQEVSLCLEHHVLRVALLPSETLIAQTFVGC